MPLQGSLGHLGLADLLQTGLSGRVGGYLTLRRGAEHAVLFVGEEGLQLLTPDPLDPIDVITAFVRRGRAPADALKGASDHQGAAARLDELISRGMVPEPELLDLLAGTAEDSILDLLTWEDGTFRYDERTLDPRHVGLVGRISVDSGGVLLRAAQRIDERSTIARDLGLHAALFAAVPADTPLSEDPDDQMPQVHQLLDGQTLIHEVALLLGIGRFAVLKCIHSLVRAGAARPANAGELGPLAHARLTAGHLGAARALALHWIGLEPINPEPVEVLVQVARARGRFDEEIAARCAIGNLLLHTSRPEEAVHAFEAALARAPNNEDALAGMRLAAQAVGDERAYARATLSLAQAALDGDDEDRAVRLGDDLCRADPSNVEAHVIRARAMVRAGNREGFIESADAVAGLLGKRARRKQDREAANYFRDSVASIAPDRADLMRRFRAVTEGNTKSLRRVGLVLAFVGVLATAGVVLWPTSPADLLNQAQAAFDRGDAGQASQIVAELVEKYPDSPEAESAFQLQTRMLYPPKKAGAGAGSANPGATGGAATAKPPEPSEIDELGRYLAALPDAEASRQLTELVTALEDPTASGRRKKVFIAHGESLPSIARRLQRDARERQDVLAQSKNACHRLDGDPEAMLAYLQDLERARDEAHVARLEQASAALTKLGSLQELDLFRSALRGLSDATGRLRRSLTTYANSFVVCEQTMARMDVDALFDRCTKEAPALLVGGRLDEADALYVELDELVKRILADERMLPVAKRIERLRIERFVRERRDIIAGIHRDLAAARSAEKSEDYGAAAQIYAGLVKRHWQIRFENVFTLPLRVTSVPAGAEVLVNGKPAGTTPLVVRYPWGAQTNVQLKATGYATRANVIDGAGAEPTSELDVRLQPETTWEVTLGRSPEARAASVGEDVLVVDRSGRATLYGGAKGEVRWARHYKSIEGVRSRPVLLDGDIVLAYVDGRVLFLSPTDGSIRNEVRAPRPLGDLAVSDGVAAIATQDRSLVTFRRGKLERKVPLNAHPTAGVIAAHGAFWIGSAEGLVVRIDARTLATTRHSVPGGHGAVVGLAPTSTGILAASTDGTLLHMSRRGATAWSKQGLGDLVGRPAAAGSYTAVSDRRGRTHFFDLRTGQPRGAAELGAEPKDGLRSNGTTFLAALRGGRLWAYETATRTVTVNALASDQTPRLAPTTLADGRLVLNLRGGRLAVCKLP